MDFADGVFKGLQLVNDYYQQKADREYKSAKDERDYALTKERNARGDYVADRSFAEGVRQYDEQMSQRQREHEDQVKHQNKSLDQANRHFYSNLNQQQKQFEDTLNWKKTVDRTKLLLEASQQTPKVLTDSDSNATNEGRSGGSGNGGNTTISRNNVIPKNIESAIDVITGKNSNLTKGQQLEKLEELKNQQTDDSIKNHISLVQSSIQTQPNEEDQLVLDSFFKEGGIDNILKLYGNCITQKGMGTEEATATVLESVNNNPLYRKALGIYFSPITNVFDLGLKALTQDGEEVTFTGYDKDSIYFKADEDGLVHAYVNARDNNGKIYYNTKIPVGIPIGEIGKNFSNYKLADQFYKLKDQQDNYARALDKDPNLKENIGLITKAVKGEDYNTLMSLYNQENQDDPIQNVATEESIGKINDWLQSKNLPSFKYLDVVTGGKEQQGRESNTFGLNNIETAERNVENINAIQNQEMRNKGVITTNISDVVFGNLNKGDVNQKGIYKISDDNGESAVYFVDPNNSKNYVILPPMVQNNTQKLDQYWNNGQDELQQKYKELQSLDKNTQEYIDKANEFNNLKQNFYRKMVDYTAALQTQSITQGGILTNLKNGVVFDDTAKVIVNTGLNTDLETSNVKEIDKILSDRNKDTMYKHDLIMKNIEEFCKNNPSVDTETVKQLVKNHYKTRAKEFDNAGGDVGQYLRTVYDMSANQIEQEFGVPTDRVEQFKSDIREGQLSNSYPMYKNENTDNLINKLLYVSGKKIDPFSYKDNNYINDNTLYNEYMANAQALKNFDIKRKPTEENNTPNINANGNGKGGYNQTSQKRSRIEMTNKYSDDVRRQVNSLLGLSDI